MELGLQPQLVDQLRLNPLFLPKRSLSNVGTLSATVTSCEVTTIMQIEAGILALLPFSSAYMKRMPATILYLALSWATDRSVDSGK
jgi:hypothetical protein